MKNKILATLLACLIAFSLQAQNHYVVKGLIGNSNEDGSWAILSTDEHTDSIQVKDGCFTFEGAIDKPALGIVKCNGLNSYKVILDGDVISIDYLNDAVYGTPCNDQFTTFRKQIEEKAYNEKVAQLYAQRTQLVAQGNSKQVAEVYEEMNRLSKAHSSLVQKYAPKVYEANRGNILGVEMINQLSIYGNYDLKTLEQLYDEASDYVKENSRLKSTIENMRARLRVAPGNHFLDFEGIDYATGKTCHLSDIVEGHVAVIDFWASWCSPCCQSITSTLIPMSNKYRDAGLVIVGIDIYDKIPNHDNAVKKLGIKYPQIIDTTANARTLYGVSGIPTIFVIDANGNFLETGSIHSGEFENDIRKALGLKPEE